MKYFVKRVIYFGSNRYCNVCEKSSRVFKKVGFVPRSDARCPFCGSLERDRLTLFFLHQRTDLFDGKLKQFLHVAPELSFEKIFRSAAGGGYITADLMDLNVMVKMDITDIQYQDESFDVIFCSHVLEHVPDDRKAIREFYRSLRPGGWAILNVPVNVDKTVEDPTVTDPEERRRLFGQVDHVRRYGPDYQDRLVEVGFNVSRVTSSDLGDEKFLIKHGIAGPGTGDVFYCTKNHG